MPFASRHYSAAGLRRERSKASFKLIGADFEKQSDYIRIDEKFCVTNFWFCSLLELHKMEGSSGGGAGGGNENSVADTRFEYMGSFVQKTLKLKPEKWMRLSTVEEHKSTIKEFLDRPLPMQLIVVLTQAAQLIPQTSFPLTQLKTKGRKY